MKKIVKLDKLQVKSFVTEMKAENANTIAGGKKVPTGGDCESDWLNTCACTFTNDDLCNYSLDCTTYGCI